MSESENQPPPPPSTKTSAVPLKKETVRITLRARPGAGSTQPSEGPSSPTKSTAPIQLPSAPLPPPAPKSATTPVKLPPAPIEPPKRKSTTAVAVSSPAAPRPPSPVPPPARPGPPIAAPQATAPQATGPRPPAAPGAPRPVAPMAPGAPRVEAGAATSSLAKTMPVRPQSRPVGAGTAPMADTGAGGAPKATVKLQQTQPMVRPSVSAPPSAPVKRSAAADSQQFEEEDSEAGLMPLSVVCLLLSVALMTIQMFGSDAVTSGPDSPIMVPPDARMRWETRNPDGTWTNNYPKVLPTIPQ